jgi:cupin 2 domain-containing protein
MPLQEDGTHGWIHPLELHEVQAGQSPVLLQGDAEIYFEEGPLVRLRAGDYLMISAHQKHRVEYTSIEPPCIWLAVHGQLRSL